MRKIFLNRKQKKRCLRRLINMLYGKCIKYELLLGAFNSKPELSNYKFEFIHSENEPEDKSKPKYYENLIEKWLPNKKIHRL